MKFHVNQFLFKLNTDALETRHTNMEIRERPLVINSKLFNSIPPRYQISGCFKYRTYISKKIHHEYRPVENDLFATRAICISGSPQKELVIKNEEFAQKNCRDEAIGTKKNADEIPYVIHCYHSWLHLSITKYSKKRQEKVGIFGLP